MIKYEANIHQGHALNTYNLCNDWINRTHANLIAAGCVQTADTGQYISNLSPDLPPENSSLGYRIYELNDAYSGVAPVYIRFEFVTARVGTGSASFRGPRLIVTVGFGTDGAGQINRGSFEKNLKSYITSSSASWALNYNPNARTFTVKGGDYFIHGNELVYGWQNQYNMLEGGFFAIIRSKINGVVNPEAITFVYGVGATVWVNAEPLRYVRITKDVGVSLDNSNAFRLPRIRSAQGLIIATQADISEGGFVEITDRLIAMRTSADESPWSLHKLSLDGLTEKTYMQLPHPPTTSFTSITADKLTTSFIPDSTEPYVGSIGILIDE